MENAVYVSVIWDSVVGCLAGMMFRVLIGSFFFLWGCDYGGKVNRVRRLFFFSF